MWTKPAELDAQEEKTKAPLESPWKEYLTPEGKKYYHNAQTKETVWDMPADHKGTPLAPVRRCLSMNRGIVSISRWPSSLG